MYFSCLRELSCFFVFLTGNPSVSHLTHWALTTSYNNNNNKFIETSRYRCRAKYTSAWIVLLAYRNRRVCSVCVPTGYKFFSFHLNIYCYVTGKRNFLKKFTGVTCSFIYWVSSQQSPAWLDFFYTWPWERFPLLSYCTSGCLHPGPALNEDVVQGIASEQNTLNGLVIFFFLNEEIVWTSVSSPIYFYIKPREYIEDRLQ